MEWENFIGCSFDWHLPESPLRLLEKWTGWILLFRPLKTSFRIEVGASVCDFSLRLLLAGTIFHAAALKRLTPSARRCCCSLLTHETCWGAKVTLAVWTLIHTHTHILTDATSRQHRRAVMTTAVSWSTVVINRRWKCCRESVIFKQKVVNSRICLCWYLRTARW